jgi:predicted TIM-barrel fold metal-dependent hydrolase
MHADELTARRPVHGVVGGAALAVVDSDGHIIEPADLWIGPYMDPSLRDRAPRISMHDGRLHDPDGSVYAEGRSWVESVNLGFERPEGQEPRYGDGRLGAHDPHGRVADLDLEGIDAVMLYPTVGLALSFVEDPVLAGAMARAYNRWLAEWCATYPERLYPVALIPSQSIDVAVEELRFAREELGVTGAAVRPHAYQGRTIHDPDWDPFWAAAAELDCPIGLHGGGSWPTPQAGADRFTAEHGDLLHVVIHPFEMQLAFVGLIGSGVFDRFPRLRVAFLESGGAWVVPVLDRLERHFDQDLGYGKTALRPRDYFDRNCWISFEPVESSLGLLADYIGPERIIWGSDYPHQDGFFPGVLASLEASMTGCSEETRVAILGGGARGFYGV